MVSKFIDPKSIFEITIRDKYTCIEYVYLYEEPKRKFLGITTFKGRPAGWYNGSMRVNMGDIMEKRQLILSGGTLYYKARCTLYYNRDSYNIYFNTLQEVENYVENLINGNNLSLIPIKIN